MTEKNSFNPALFFQLCVIENKIDELELERANLIRAAAALVDAGLPYTVENIEAAKERLANINLKISKRVSLMQELIK